MNQNRACIDNLLQTINLLHKLHNLLPGSALITKYKAFAGPHFDYEYILSYQTCNSSFHENLESIQYNACLALIEAIRGSSEEKIYQELALGSLRVRRWFKKLCLFYKVLNNEHSQYLFNLIPARRTSYSTANANSSIVFRLHSICYVTVVSI